MSSVEEAHKTNPAEDTGSPKSPKSQKSPKTPTSPNYEFKFLVPSPHTTRRTRTKSQCERAAAGPTFQGTVKDFCRNKGHGFIKPNDGGESLFCHISDIEGDYVLKKGDIVQYKTHLIPPKNEKMQAVHVEIIHPAEGVIHETWDADALRN